MSRFFVLIMGCFLLAAVGGVSPVRADDGPKAEAEAHDEHDDHAAPSVPMGFRGDLALWSLVTFFVFLFVLKKLAWTPMIEGLDKREANLRQQAADTQHALEKAQSLLTAHEAKLAEAQDEVQAIIAEAKRDAERTSQDIIATAQREAEATRERAVEDIGRARDVALKELFDAMSGQVAGATEHVLGRALSDDDQNRLIDEALQQVSAS